MALADFLAELVECGELKRVAAPVDARLEVAEITRRVAEAAGPALLFANVRGHSLPVVTNLLGTEARACRALGDATLEDLPNWLEELAAKLSPPTWLDRFKLTSEPASAEKFRPKAVKTAPCQQVVRLGRDIDLTSLPALQCWPAESNVVLCGRLIIPGSENRHEVVSCRFAVLDSQRLALLDDGQDCIARLRQAAGEHSAQPVALAIGGDPLQGIAAAVRWPEGADDYLLCGLLRGRPLEVVKARSQPLEVPADADMVLEATVESNFNAADVLAGGLWSEHYAQPSPNMVLQVGALTQRTSPILPAIVPHHCGELQVLARINERILFSQLRVRTPEIVNLALPPWGGPQGYAVVSMHKAHAAHARQVAAAVWGWPCLRGVKFLLLVDADVDVHDTRQVLARVAANVHPARDVFFHTGPAFSTDHATPQSPVGSALGIDATAKLPAEHPGGWPQPLVAGEDLRQAVAARWSELGLPAEWLPK